MDKEIWTAFEAAAATGGTLCARGGGEEAAEITEEHGVEREFPEETWAARGLSIDTRTIMPGDMFVALNAARDGHDFVHAAFAAGAVVALVSKAPPNLPDGAPLLMVNDTLEGVSQLAAAARDRCFGKLIAITGSAGKTSTKEMLRAALAPSGVVHAADKSFNNYLGVPLTLAQLPSGADFGVFEIGMNHAGEITPLSELVEPHVAIITSVAEAHLAYFENVEAIARAKAEIFAGVRPGGAVILPRDNTHFDYLAGAARDADVETIVTFGRHEQADVRLVSYEGGFPSVAVIETDMKRRTVCLNIPGEHQAMNALATIAALQCVGADVAAGCATFADMRPVSGRGERYKLCFDARVVEIIDESYNANPASMEAAIKMLGATPLDENTSGRRVVILGEMRELGEAAASLHAALADTLIMANISQVYAAGGLMRNLFESLPYNMRGRWAENASDLAENLTEELKNGDIVMAKGSNASKVGHLLTLLQKYAGTDRKANEALCT